MIKHDNVYPIEWPLGVITAIYPDEKGVIRTAEVEECGRRSLQPVSYLVPLELDCHREDDKLRQCLRENQRNEEEDDDDIDDAAVTMDVDSISEAEDQGSPIVSADAQERSFPLDASSSRSTLLHRTSGSSPRERPGHRHHNWVQHQRSFSHHHLTVSPTIQLSTHANFRG